MPWLSQSDADQLDALVRPAAHSARITFAEPRTRRAAQYM